MIGAFGSYDTTRGVLDGHVFYIVTICRRSAGLWHQLWVVTTQEKKEQALSKMTDILFLGTANVDEWMAFRYYHAKAAEKYHMSLQQRERIS